jgi:hypothetical protein
MSQEATDNSIMCRSSASRFRLINRLVSPDSQDSPSSLSLEYNGIALARPKRTNASFVEDFSPAAKQARMCSYLQEALDLYDIALTLLDEDDDIEK